MMAMAGRITIVVGTTLLALSPAAAQSGKSLAKCETAAARETGKYSGAMQKALAKCLDKIAQETLQKADPLADAARACATQLRKIRSTEHPERALSAKFQANVSRACDPNSPSDHVQHTQDAALDTNQADGLQAGLLDTYCGSFGGDGALGSVSEWIACAGDVAICSALQQLAVEYPRASEWLGGIATAIAALDPNQPRYTDAAGVAAGLRVKIDSDLDGVADIGCGPPTPEDAPLWVVPVTGQTTAYGSGSDGDVQAGMARSFTDKGNGTITDEVTGLMWEKKSKDGSIHDVDNAYTWTTGTNDMDGTIATTFLAILNGDESGCQGANDPDPCCTGAATGSCDGFAGFTDWRIPNSIELYSLVNLGASDPATYSEFDSGCTEGCTVATCSCTGSFGYYYASSSTVSSADPDELLSVYFSSGHVTQRDKVDGGYPARAVRGGL